MKLSKKGEYVLRSLINLGVGAAMKRRSVQVSELAESKQLPVKFPEQTLQVLREAGIVESRRNFFWGYCLVRPVRGVLIGEVVRLMDGLLTRGGKVTRGVATPPTEGVLHHILGEYSI